MFGGGTGFGGGTAPRFGGGVLGGSNAASGPAAPVFGGGGSQASSPFRFGGAGASTPAPSPFASSSPSSTPWGTRPAVSEGGGSNTTSSYIPRDGSGGADRGGGIGGGFGRGGAELGGRGISSGRGPGLGAGRSSSVPFSPFGVDPSVSTTRGPGTAAPPRFGGGPNHLGGSNRGNSQGYKWGDSGASIAAVTGPAPWAQGGEPRSGPEDAAKSSFRPRFSQQQPQMQMPGDGSDTYASGGGGRGGGRGMGGFTYACSVCQAAFPTKALLKSHLSESNHWSTVAKDEHVSADGTYRPAPSPSHQQPLSGLAPRPAGRGGGGGGRNGGRGSAPPPPRPGPRQAPPGTYSWEPPAFTDQRGGYPHTGGADEVKRESSSGARVSFRTDGPSSSSRGDRTLPVRQQPHNYGRAVPNPRPMHSAEDRRRGPGFKGDGASSRSPRSLRPGGSSPSAAGGVGRSSGGGAISSPESTGRATETDATEDEENDIREEEDEGENTERNSDEDSQLNYSQDEQDQHSEGEESGGEEDNRGVLDHDAPNNIVSTDSNLYGGMQQMAPPSAASVSKLLDRMKRPPTAAAPSPPSYSTASAEAADVSKYASPLVPTRTPDAGLELSKFDAKSPSASPFPTRSSSSGLAPAKVPTKAPAVLSPDERVGPTPDKPFFSAKFNKKSSDVGSLVEEERTGPTADKPFFSTKFNKKSEFQASQSSPISTTPLPSTPAVVHLDGQLVGQCPDMCPASERIRRINEKDVHRLELPYPEGLGKPSDPSGVMIKKYQRSAADHVLAVPELVRSPPVLLRTMDYIQSQLMERDLDSDVDPRFDEVPSTLEVYLYIWNRLRMVAKDFILQNYRFGGRNDRYCIECHERMVRWLIMMDHQLHDNKEYTDTHAQQNSEQLNKCLKSLNEFYDDARTRRESPDGQKMGGVIECPNEGEFRAYYILHQLDNEGQVESYVTSLSPEVLASAPIQYALQIVASRRVQNYATFFRLIREGAYLEGCSLLKYVGFMRIQALKVLCRTMRPAKQVAMHPVADLTHLMLFDDDDQTADFLDYCGLKMDYSVVNSEGGVSPPEEVFCVALDGRNIVDSLPVHEKSGAPLLPDTKPFVRVLESKIASAKLSRSDVVLGHSSRGARPFLGSPSDEQEFYRRQVLLTRSAQGKTRASDGDASTPSFVSRLAGKPSTLATPAAEAQLPRPGLSSPPFEASPARVVPASPVPATKAASPVMKSSPLGVASKMTVPITFEPPLTIDSAAESSPIVFSTVYQSKPAVTSPTPALAAVSSAPNAVAPFVFSPPGPTLNMLAENASKNIAVLPPPASGSSNVFSFIDNSIATQKKPPPSPEISRKRASSKAATSTAPLEFSEPAPVLTAPTTVDVEKAKEDQQPVPIQAAPAQVTVPVVSWTPPVTGIAATPASSARLNIDVATTWKLSPGAIFETSSVKENAGVTAISSVSAASSSLIPPNVTDEETRLPESVRPATIVLPEVVVEFLPRNFGLQSAPEPISDLSSTLLSKNEPSEEGENPVVISSEADLFRVVNGTDLSDEQRHHILDVERDVAEVHRLSTQRRIFLHMYGQVFAHIENYRLKRLRILFRCWSRIYKTRTTRRAQFGDIMRSASIAANPDLLAQTETERRMLDSFSRLAVMRGDNRRQASPPRYPVKCDGVLEGARPLFELKQEWFRESFSVGEQVADSLRAAHVRSLMDAWNSASGAASSGGLDAPTISTLVSSCDAFWKLSVLSTSRIPGAGLAVLANRRSDCLAATAIRALLSSSNSSGSYRYLTSFNFSGAIGNSGMHIRVVDAPCLSSHRETTAALAGSNSIIVLIPRYVLANNDDRDAYAASVRQSLGALRGHVGVACVFTDDDEPSLCSFGEIDMTDQQNSAAAKFIKSLNSSSSGSSITIEGVFFVSIKASLMGTAEAELALRSCLVNALCRVARSAHLSEPLLQRLDVERAAVRSALTAAVIGIGSPPRSPLRTESTASFIVSLASRCIQCANAKVNNYLLILEQTMGSNSDAVSRLPALDFALQQDSASEDGFTHLIGDVCIIDDTRSTQALGLESRFDCLLRSILSPTQQFGPSTDDLLIALARLCNDPCASLRHGAGRASLSVGVTPDSASGGEVLSLLEGRYNVYAALHSTLSEYILESIDVNTSGIDDADAMVSSVLRPYVERLEAHGWKAARAILEGSLLAALRHAFLHEGSVPFYEISVLIIEWVVGMISARLSESLSHIGDSVRAREIVLPWCCGPGSVPSTLPWYLHKQRTSQPELSSGTYAPADAADGISRKRPWDFHGHDDTAEIEASEIRNAGFSSPSSSSANSGRLRMRSTSPPLGLVARSPPPTTAPLSPHALRPLPLGGSSSPPLVPPRWPPNPPATTDSPDLEEFDANVKALYDSFYS